MKRYRVRWQEGGRWDVRAPRGRRAVRRGDSPPAAHRDAHVARRRKESVDIYVSQTWAPTFAAILAPKTRRLYTLLYDTHISPTLGGVLLRELRPETISRWQSERIAADAGAAAVRKSLTLLGGILQRAVESGRTPTNPARLVRGAPMPRRAEVRPLSPDSIEKMRAASSPRDAALLSVLAYAGLRPRRSARAQMGRCARSDAVDRAQLVARQRA